MTCCTSRFAAAAGALLAGFWFALASPARAATWADERTTPHLRDLVVIDRTGEAGWLFGSEDVAGDGLTRFEASERGVDVRTAYVAVDAGRLWLRAYVSSEQPPDPELRVYFFIDTDDNEHTGGSAAAPDIDPTFTADASAGGYEYVLGVQGNNAVGAVWQWQALQSRYELANLAPLAAAAEAGIDLDPLRALADVHGYVQLSLNAGQLGVAASCKAHLLLRSSTGRGLADLDVGVLQSCVADDRNRNGVADVLEASLDAGCERDEQCPASALCLGGRCIFPVSCRGDADCASDERCTAEDVCRAEGGASCAASPACAGGLVCGSDNQCRACTLDDMCGTGERCARSGRCVDESAGSATGARGALVLEPGQELQGGAGSCALDYPTPYPARGGFFWLLGFTVLALGVRGGLVLRRGLVLSALALVLLASPAARAQLDAERLKPAVTHDGWVNAEGSGVRHPDDPWEFGASLSYAHNPLIIANADNELVDPLVAGRLGLDLLGSVSLSQRFAVGLALPLFAQHGPASPSSFGVGDLRIVPKLELASDLEDGVGFALAAEVRAPSHSGDFAGGARAFAIFPKVILDHRYRSGLRIGANLGVILREDQSFLNVTQGDEMAYAAAVSYRFGGLSGKTEAGVELNGGTNLAHPGDEEVALEALGFLRRALGPEWQAQGGVGAGVLDGYGVPSWRVFFGVSFSPTSHDRDYDGVPDSKDKCGEFAEDRDGIQDADGCPEEDLDSDQDGVSDAEDRCPTAKETINGFEDGDGCPDAGARHVIFDDGEFVVIDTIHFETGSSIIHPSAHSLLDQVALTLRANPAIEHIRIDGHTDDTGPRDVNMALSQKRALAVKRYLVERGVSPQRLRVKSYGPDRPRETGTDAQTRAKNRRVEFIVE
jgi:OmpA-OmpF porin, OOP family